MRALLAIEDEMRDEFDEPRRVAGLALFGRENVEPQPLRLRRPVSHRLAIEIVARLGRQRLVKEIDLAEREGAVARPHQGLRRRRRLARFENGRAASGIRQRRRVAQAAGAGRVGHVGMRPARIIALF